MMYHQGFSDLKLGNQIEVGGVPSEIVAVSRRGEWIVVVRLDTGEKLPRIWYDDHADDSGDTDQTPSLAVSLDEQGVLERRYSAAHRAVDKRYFRKLRLVPEKVRV